MKYGIITHYNVLNHGAVLQLEALIRVLKGLEIEAKALQYERDYSFTDEKLKAKYRIGLGSLIYFIQFIKERGIGNFLFLFKKKKILSKYKKEKGLIGEHFQRSRQLDGVVIGSDEVFGLDIGKTPVLFGYGLPSKKIFAYAGSFGSTDLEEIEKKGCRDFVANSLKNMSGLSMRDQNSIAIAKNLCGITPELVCDPVILYGFGEEMKTMARQMPEKYMVVYSYDQNMNENGETAAIKSFAAQKGLKIISPSFYHRWVDRNVNVDPMELLGWFNYAEYVVTDTFHGCVMSLITNREFAVMVRDNSNKICSLMEIFGLYDRIIALESLEEILDNKIDWTLINKIISETREKSMDYLIKMISC